MKLLSLARTASLSALFLFGSLLANESHTPYPAQSDEAAWPGAGPIRVGSWMHDNRAYFSGTRGNDQNAVVFVGDSLIGGWKGLGKAFPGIKVANRGIGGDVSRGVLFRLQDDVLTLNPRAIVFCVGSNDLSAHAKVPDFITNMALIVNQARESNPNLPIVLCTIPPRNAPNAPILPGSLDEFNRRLKSFGREKQNLVVLDLFTAFATPEGTPHPEYIGKDGIHITPAGFEKSGTLLRPVLQTLGITADPAKAN